MVLDHEREEEDEDHEREEENEDVCELSNTRHRGGKPRHSRYSPNNSAFPRANIYNRANPWVICEQTWLRQV